MTLYQGNVKLPVTKCKRPSFKPHRGRSWGSETIYIDGVKKTCWCDSTWGSYLYFQDDKLNWYKLRMFSSLGDKIDYHVDVFSIGKNLLTTKIEPMKQAVCALIYTSDFKILGVSRKDAPDQMGLIGGKVDEGETPEQALIRETKEETGLTITKFKKIFERSDGEFECFTYLCEVKEDIETNEEGILEKGVTEKGVVKKLGWPELLEGPFGEYNKQLLNHLRGEITETYKGLKNNYG